MGRRKRYRKVVYDYVWSPTGSGDPDNWSDESIDALVDLLLQSDKEAKERKADALLDSLLQSDKDAKERKADERL